MLTTARPAEPPPRPLIYAILFLAGALGMSVSLEAKQFGLAFACGSFAVGAAIVYLIRADLARRAKTSQSDNRSAASRERRPASHNHPPKNPLEINSWNVVFVWQDGGDDPYAAAEQLAERLHALDARGRRASAPEDWRGSGSMIAVIHIHTSLEISLTAIDGANRWCMQIAIVGPAPEPPGDILPPSNADQKALGEITADVYQILAAQGCADMHWAADDFPEDDDPAEPRLR